jgi:multiple sugar transport system permease protein
MKKRYTRSDSLTPYLYVGPMTLMLMLVSFFPLLYNIFTSFHNYQILSPEDYKFVGFANYVRTVKDGDFWHSVIITLRFSLAAVSLELVLGLILALLLNRKNTASRHVYRTLMMLPIIMTPIAVAYMWRVVYAPSTGILNYLLSLLGISGPAWVADVNWALPSLIIVDVWQWTPFLALILLSGLMSLPQEPYEAAKVDGASVGQSFWFITLPLLRPIILVAVLIRLIDSFKLFDIVYAMTGGGPVRVTETFNFYIYTIAFRYLDIGYACTLTVTLLIMIGVLSLALIKVSRIHENA